MLLTEVRGRGGRMHWVNANDLLGNILQLGDRALFLEVIGFSNREFYL